MYRYKDTNYREITSRDMLDSYIYSISSVFKKAEKVSGWDNIIVQHYYSIKITLVLWHEFLIRLFSKDCSMYILYDIKSCT